MVKNRPNFVPVEVHNVSSGIEDEECVHCDVLPVADVHELRKYHK